MRSERLGQFNSPNLRYALDVEKQSPLTFMYTRKLDDAVMPIARNAIKKIAKKDIMQKP
jgi:hypothetical protein